MTKKQALKKLEAILSEHNLITDDLGLEEILTDVTKLVKKIRSEKESQRITQRSANRNPLKYSECETCSHIQHTNRGKKCKSCGGNVIKYEV